MIDSDRHDMFWQLIHSFTYLFIYLDGLLPFGWSVKSRLCILEKIIMTSVNFCFFLLSTVFTYDHVSE